MAAGDDLRTQEWSLLKLKACSKILEVGMVYWEHWECRNTCLRAALCDRIRFQPSSAASVRKRDGQKMLVSNASTHPGAVMNAAAGL